MVHLISRSDIPRVFHRFQKRPSLFLPSKHLTKPLSRLCVFDIATRFIAFDLLVYTRCLHNALIVTGLIFFYTRYDTIWGLDVVDLGM